MIPDSLAFTLEDVNIEIYGSVNISKTMRDCFDDADPAKFDPFYEGTGTRLSHFRNYDGFMFPPFTTTNAVTDISTYTAVANGEVTLDLGRPVLEIGFVWRRKSLGAPTLSVYDGKWSDEIDIKYEFDHQMTGLLEDTEYYVKAFARNLYGSALSSNTREFKTLPWI